jgi:hypothetical protein
MHIELPLYRQEKPKTCALACLRMVLAAFGTKVEEKVLESRARMEKGGTPIDELERLARQFGLVAEIEETTMADMRRILSEGRLPIAYIDRAIFDLSPNQRSRHSLRDARIHTVVPTHVSAASVTFHDPLPPRITRKSSRLFQSAHRILGSYSVVCSRRENQ